MHIKDKAKNKSRVKNEKYQAPPPKKTVHIKDCYNETKLFVRGVLLSSWDLF
jgi:hypothetical protein